ncbi:MAG: MBOAT family protein [Bacteroidetes bacterium]|nr:MBOAT family protein [Bacteroidota bacterium]
MLFNSLQFIFFFPIVVALYFVLKPKYRWVLLLLASYYFYMCWNYKYVVLIITSTLIDYVSGILLYKAGRKRYRIFFLLLSLGTNLGLLFFFKYFNFFSDSLNVIFSKLNIFYETPTYNYLLPVGISFYTFQTLSYTIDIYRGKREPEYHLGKFALFVSFFPQLVAGPIERSVNLLPQFSRTYKFEYERVKSGILLMVWGFFKKVVIADRLAEYVNLVYNNASDYSGIQHGLATLFFSFQIYCDFSGYSDIAIGAALIMGYNLMTNFKRPYLSQNIGEFWRRWHISLSTWFRDYVYIPLGGNRVAKWRWQVNLFITFLVSGLWHGANWTFVVWGGLHGFYLVFALWINKLTTAFNSFTRLDRLPELHRVLRIIKTFILVIFAWIFFRANSLGDALLIIQRIFIFEPGTVVNLYQYKADLVIALGGIALLVFIEVLEEQIGLYARLKKLGRPVKWVLVISLLLLIILLGKWNEADFLYFQF